MKQQPLEIPNYEAAVGRESRKIAFAIALFVLVYLVLVFTVLIGSIAALALAVGIVIYMHNILAALIGIGLLIMVGLIVIFLFKFIFKRNKHDRSAYLEINEQEEPKLFALIKEVAESVQTQLPKHVYLTGNVEAYVFYDSTFWSMFFPIRKNLVLGAGLINTCSVQELKAIIGHEFGHFSQKSMKFGSYAYQVNRVLHDMLFDNEDYSRLAGSLASGHAVFNFFVESALFFARGIQTILIWLYGLINKQYSNLSIAMEFQADQIGATVAGSKALTEGLLRIDLANSAYVSVLEYYQEQIARNQISENIYPKHVFVMHQLAKRLRFAVENTLPKVPLEFNQRFHQSKLNLGNQWESHPALEDRVAHLDALNTQPAFFDNAPASTLFSNFEQTGAVLTRQLFQTVKYEQPPVAQSIEQFKDEYLLKQNADNFPSLYNGYYDFHNPEVIDIEHITPDSGNTHSVQSLFSDEVVSLLFKHNGLEHDLATLKSIQEQGIKIRSFDYNGEKYSGRSIPALMPLLEAELNTLKAQLIQQQQLSFAFFAAKAIEQGKLPMLQQAYRDFYELLAFVQTASPDFQAMAAACDFIWEQHEIHVIIHGMNAVYEREKHFKVHLKTILSSPLYTPFLTPEDRASLEQFANTNWQYFNGQQYNEAAVKLLNDSFKIVPELIRQVGFSTKKHLLDFQASLVPELENE